MQIKQAKEAEKTSENYELALKELVGEKTKIDVAIKTLKSDEFEQKVLGQYIQQIFNLVNEILASITPMTITYDADEFILIHEGNQ